MLLPAEACLPRVLQPAVPVPAMAALSGVTAFTEQGTCTSAEVWTQMAARHWGGAPLPGGLLCLMGVLALLVLYQARANSQLRRTERACMAAVQEVRDLVAKLGTASEPTYDSGLWNEVLFADLRAQVQTARHVMDMMASQDRQWYQLVGQLEEVFNSHVELTKAVNVLLSDLAARMPKTATATTILEHVRSLKELVQPLAVMPEKLLATLEGVDFPRPPTSRACQHPCCGRDSDVHWGQRQHYTPGQGQRNPRSGRTL